MYLFFFLACDQPDPASRPIKIDTVEFTLGGEPLLSLPIESLELGIVRPRDVGYSYLPSYTIEAGTQWMTPVSATQLNDTITLTYPGELTASLSLESAGPDGWRLVWTPDPGMDVGFFRLAARGDSTEGFYGLGETFDHVHHRGQVRDMHVEPTGGTESGYNEVHVPVPLLIGTSGWALFVRDDHPMRFEVATDADDTTVVTVGTGEQSDAGLEFFVWLEEKPLDLTRRYYDLTGYPELPAPWALGPVFWRNDTTGQVEVQADIDAMRALDLPANALWLDRPYATAVNTFDFDPTKYSDADAMIDHAHDQGFRVGLWHTPYASEDAGAVREEALTGGFFPPLVPPLLLSFVRWGELVDLTNPAATTWWQGHIHSYTSRGIEGFKLDFAEDIVPGLAQSRVPWRFFDGSDERTMHRNYQRLYHRTYREVLGQGQGFLLCRAAAWGDQTHGVIIWPGDIDGNLAYHGEDMGDYVAVGGLPAAVIASVGLGPSGFPFFGSDTGGYRHTPPDKETFTRWFEHTALSSVMQIGMGSSDVVWDPVRDWDEEMLRDYRDYSRLHLRLFPYLWTHAQRIRTTGHPLQQPLGLAYPELGEQFDFDYLLGDELLVAPVVRPSQTTRRVVLPAGQWVDWFDGDVLSGGEHVVDAPLSKIPLFLKQGGIVPLLRPTIDTLSPVAEPTELESFAADPGVLTVRVFPGAAGEFELYDGTRIGQVLGDDGVATLSYSPGSVFTAGVEFEVLGLGAEVLRSSLFGEGETRVSP